MNNSKKEELIKVYNEYEKIINKNRIKYTMILGAFSLASVYFSTDMGFIGFGLTIGVPTLISARNFNKNIRDFKNKHKDYDLPSSIFEINDSYNKELKKIELGYKKDYVNKCEEIKKEVVSPIYNDVSYDNELGFEKVKVRIRKK